MNSSQYHSPGYVIEHEGKRMSVIKIQLIQPGKGGAFRWKCATSPPA